MFANRKKNLIAFTVAVLIANVLVANTAFGISRSTTFNLTVTESVKPAPTDISVVSACGAGENDREAIMSWDNMPGATGYRVYRSPAFSESDGSTVNGPYKQLNSGTETTFTDTGLSDGGFYGYRVAETYSGGQESALSSPVSTLTLTNADCSSNSTVSLACTGLLASMPDCVAEYGGSVSLTPVGQSWNSCTTASTPTHTGWNSASWLVSSLAINPAYVAPTSDLIAYYKFDETSGTIASDSYGSNNGTLINNPTWATAGKFSGALSFDGINNYVDTKDFSFSKNDSFTFSVWAKTLAFGASQVMFGKPVSGWEYSLMTYGTNSVRFAYWNTSGNAEIDLYSPSNSFPNNTWTDFVISYDSSAPTKIAKMYVNGVEKTSDNTISNTFQNRTNNLWVGAGYYGGLQRYFNGSIDDVRIYNKALSATEVQKLYYSNFKASGDKYVAGDLKDKNKYTFKFSCEKDGGTTESKKAYICVKPPVVQISATALDSSTIKVEWSKPTNLDNSFVLSYTLNDEIVPCSLAICSKTYTGLTPNTPYTYQLKTLTPEGSCGVLYSSSSASITTPPPPATSGFELSATSPIKISAISSAPNNDLISTPSTIKIEPSGGFNLPVVLSLLSVTKFNSNTNNWETVADISKFIYDFSLPSVGPSNYSNGSKFTIISKKGIGNGIPTGKYTLTIKGVGDGKDDTVDIVLNVGILSFDYREY